MCPIMQFLNQTWLIFNYSLSLAILCSELLERFEVSLTTKEMLQHPLLDFISSITNIPCFEPDIGSSAVSDIGLKSNNGSCLESQCTPHSKTEIPLQDNNVPINKFVIAIATVKPVTREVIDQSVIGLPCFDKTTNMYSQYNHCHVFESRCDFKNIELEARYSLLFHRR